jgi:phosphohistidine phosphatase
MRLYFMRHGIAEDGTPDAERALTKEGVNNTKLAAQKLKALGVSVAHLYSSPLVRARQTAEIVAQALNTEVEIRDEVGPGFSITAVQAMVSDVDREDSVMFVGHEPDFSTTITSLVGGRIVMKKGGLARVDVISDQPLLGKLVWLIAPKFYEESR